jgi:hypothetical protein
MVSLGVPDAADGLQIWRLAANILNKQSRTADKGNALAWGSGEGLTTPHRKKKKKTCYEMLHRAS